MNTRRLQTERGIDLLAQALKANIPEAGWSVTWREYKPQRSLEQNAKWHAMVAELAAESGNTPECMKEYLKATIGLVLPLTTPDGEIKHVPKPTHRYKVGEMADLIHRTYEWGAAEMGYIFRE